MSAPAKKLSRKAEDLLGRVRELPQAERRLFGYRLREDAAPPLSQAWKDEIERRLDALDRGEAKLVNGPASSRRIREKLRKRHGR